MPRGTIFILHSVVENTVNQHGIKSGKIGVTITGHVDVAAFTLSQLIGGVWGILGISPERMISYIQANRDEDGYLEIKVEGNSSSGRLL